MKPNKEKQFDCIKMKNHIQTQIYAETKNMSAKELLNYFNNTVNDYDIQKSTLSGSIVADSNLTKR
jgi:hypothetical protein